MKTNSRFLFAVSFVLAMALTFGCSDNSGGTTNDNGQGGNQNIPSVSTCPNAVTGNGILSCGGQTYKTVSIDGQVWMAENMNYNANATGSKCLDNLTSNCTTYGRLYNWATAMVVCPAGWHLPNNADWEKLFRYVDSQNGGNGAGNLYNNSYISLLGKYLKTKEGWTDCGPLGSGKYSLCEDTFGFSALPGGGAGYTFPDIYNFTQIDVGDWWSSEGNNSEAYYLHIFSYDDAGYESNPSTYLKSVRCLKDGNSIGGTLSSSSSLPQSNSSDKLSSSSSISSSSSSILSSPSVGCTAANNTPTQYCSNGTMKTYGSVTDGVQTYKTVVIGTQTWMAENLNYNATNSRCYGGNNGGDSQGNCAKYGRLYDWATAMGISSNYNSSYYNPSSSTKYRGVCPSGWHLPSNAEWNVLMKFVNPSCSDNSSCAGAGTKLKATSGWNAYSGVPSGSDTYGFSALPGGGGYSDGYFYDVGGNGDWWSASESISDGAYSWYMYYSIEYASWHYNDKSYLFSVRCLQD